MQEIPDYIYDEYLMNKDEAEEVLHRISVEPFYFQSQGIGAAEDGIVGIRGSSFLDRPILVSGSNYPNDIDNLRPVAKSILDRFMAKHGLEYDEVIRTRTNISFRTSDPRPTIPHVDLLGETKHYVFLYYLNSSDGDTILFSQKGDGSYRSHLDLSEMKRFSPVGGGALLFNGDYLHTWEHPTVSDYRSTMNLNISVPRYHSKNDIETEALGPIDSTL